MKKAFLFLLILFSINCSAKVIIRNTTCWNLEYFVDKCCDSLKIDSCTIVIQSVDGLISGKYFAVVTGNSGVYCIGISSRLFYNDCVSAVAHEVVHIQQLQSGRLKILDRKTIGFDGALKQVSADSHIDDDHEKEATKVGNLLVKRYKKI